MRTLLYSIRELFQGKERLVVAGETMLDMEQKNGNTSFHNGAFPHRTYIEMKKLFRFVLQLQI